MIDEGFTEKQLRTEFTWETLRRYLMYREELTARQTATKKKKPQHVTRTDRGFVAHSKQAF